MNVNFNKTLVPLSIIFYTFSSDHSRRRPKVLPEILTRAQREGTEKEDFTFVTQHKRKVSNEVQY